MKKISDDQPGADRSAMTEQAKGKTLTLEDVIYALELSWKKQGIYVGNLPVYEYAGLGGMAEFVLHYFICDDVTIVLSLAFTGLLMDCRDQTIDANYLNRINPELYRLACKLPAEDVEAMTRLVKKVEVAVNKQLGGNVQ